jgi:hypothetical protein
MGDLISLHERRYEKYLNQSVEYTAAIATDFMSVVDRYDHHREDLWYLRLIIQQFVGSINFKVHELGLNIPPVSLRLQVSKEPSTVSTPSYWSVSIGNEQHLPRLEVIRFTAKITSRAKRFLTIDEYDNPGKIWHEAYIDLLTEDGNGDGIIAADDILFRGYEDANLALLPNQNGSARLLVDPQPDALCFGAMASTIKGDVLATIARRYLPDNKVLTITSFYNTQSVRRHFNAFQNGYRRVNQK